MKKLRELTVEELFESFVLIKNADVRVAKNGKKFIAFTFQDTSGTIDGKYWDASEDEITRFTAGNVVLLNGKREVYQNKPQVKILHMRLATAEEPSQPSLYMERAPLKKEEMVEEINQVIFEITNAHWNRIVRYLMTKYQQEFYEFPEINTSLLYAGIILHDLGKVLELSGAITTEYTVAGNLIGHLVLVDEEITKACLALKIDDREEDVVVLRHMVLAHHGLLEYGSPVRPRIMEAEILHQIDTMDASIQMMLGAIRQTQPGEYTERIFGLDNRSFYVPKDK